MQTFLPYPDFLKSAQHLDSRRLNNQVNECKAILRSLLTGTGWIYHPAVLMWKGHEHYLGLYRDTILHEWIKRGGANTRPLFYEEIDFGFQVDWSALEFEPPSWLGDERLHSSHRAVLQWKEITNNELIWYAKFGWAETPEYAYYWPVRSAKVA